MIFSRRVIIENLSVYVSLVFCLASLVNANVAVLPFFIGFLWAFVVAAQEFYSLIKKRDINRKNIITCLILLASYPVSMFSFNLRLERTMEPYIVKLNDYKQLHGKFPMRIDELGMGVPVCPNGKDGLRVYGIIDGGENYRLSCQKFNFFYARYNSKEAVWATRSSD